MVQCWVEGDGLIVGRRLGFMLGRRGLIVQFWVEGDGLMLGRRGWFNAGLK
jgi:hypothetical protein